MGLGVGGCFLSSLFSYLEDAFHISANGHLFVQLWALCKTGLPVEVLYSEDFRASLRRAADEFWRVDLDKVFLREEVSEEVGDGLKKGW